MLNVCSLYRHDDVTYDNDLNLNRFALYDKDDIYKDDIQKALYMIRYRAPPQVSRPTDLRLITGSGVWETGGGEGS